MTESRFQIWKAWKMEKNVAWCEVHTIMYKENILDFSGNTFLKEDTFLKNSVSPGFQRNSPMGYF